MTNRNVELLDLLGNAMAAEHGDVLRAALAETLSAFMDAEVGDGCNPGLRERRDARQNQRNGYREHGGCRSMSSTAALTALDLLGGPAELPEYEN